MPLEPAVFAGRDAMVEAWPAISVGPNALGQWLTLATAANPQQAVANYLRRRGEPTYQAFNLDVLRVRSGLVTEVTSFGPDLFPTFGLPASL
jgi:hypothetical protein